MTRTAARQLAVQLCFAANSGGDVTPEEFFRDGWYSAMAEDAMISEKPGPEEVKYICEVVNGVAAHAGELDRYISRYSQRWKLSRISKTALCILRCALYEMLYMPDIPPAASINEAVELAKNYDEPETVGFINGVLGGFARDRADGNHTPEA